MTEAELTRAAAHLGKDAVRGLDSEQLAHAVLARLAAEPDLPVAPPRRILRRWLPVLAAAAAVILVVRLTVSGPAVPPAGFASGGGSSTVLHELDDLSASELEALLESLPADAGAAVHPEPASFDELDTKSLERLLRSLEG